MAFTGVATVKLVSDQLVRITGVSLDAGEEGTIGLFEATGAPPDVVLPEDFSPMNYGSIEGIVRRQQSVQVDVLPEGAPLMVVKTGLTKQDFRITITNVSSGGGGGALVPGNSELNSTFGEE